MKDVIGLLVIVALIAYACSPGKLEDRPDYKKGYEAGFDDGQEQERSNVCSEIERAKDSIHSFLQDVRICP